MTSIGPATASHEPSMAVPVAGVAVLILRGGPF
jgi:hypothetical protein